MRCQKKCCCSTMRNTRDVLYTPPLGAIGNRGRTRPPRRSDRVAESNSRREHTGGRPFPRPAWLLVCLLALATGLALLAAGESMIDPAPRTADGVGAADAAVVNGFYAAVNAVLDAGDPAAL